LTHIFPYVTFYPCSDEGQFVSGSSPLKLQICGSSPPGTEEGAIAPDSTPDSALLSLLFYGDDRDEVRIQMTGLRKLSE